MIDTATPGTDTRAPDPVNLERALQRAALDLQRVVVTVAQRYLGNPRRARQAEPPSLTWRTLLAIEEQTLGNLGFQGRHDPAVRAAFIRVDDSRLPVTDLDEPVDWQRDEDDQPVVYLIVRALLQAETAETAASS